MAEPSSDLGFLAGGGEAGALLRALDWTANPLGAPGKWPQPLKTLVGIMLGSRQPMFVAWGPARVMIYNDGYAELCRDRHPAAMGAPFARVWWDIMDAVGPILDKAFAGEATHMDDIAFELMRDGRRQEAHFAFSYTPVRNDGEVLGMFCACTETTDAVLGERQRDRTERRLRFVSELDAALRATTDAPAAMQAAAETLARFLGASRCAYADVDPDSDRFVIRSDFAVPGIESSAGTYSLQLFGPRAVANMRGGQTLVIRDVAAELAPDEGREMFQAIDIAAIVCCPLIKQGRLVAMMAVHQVHPRDWDKDEIAIIGAAVERCWAHIERVAAEARLRESEARYRTLFENIDAGFCIIELLFEGARAVDYRYVEVNPAFERQSGISHAVGRRMREFAPRLEERWFDIYGRVALTGEPTRFESEVAFAGRWFDVHAFRVGEAGDARVAILFNDISERKAAELELRALNETLEVRVDQAVADRDRAWKYSRDLQAIVDLDGMCVAASEAWTTVLGWDTNEIVGHDHSKFFHPDDIAPTGKALAVAREGPLPAFENRYRHKDGSYRTISWVAAREGDLIYASGRDVTAEKERAAALRLYRNIVQSDEAPVLAFDTQLQVIAFNRAHAAAWHRLFGRLAATGEVLPNLFPPDQGEMVRRDMERALAGEAFTVVGEIGDPACSTVTYEVSYTPLRDEAGQIVGAFSHARDLTERLRSEAELASAQEALRQSQKMEAMGQLTGGVAHDFNNLLTPIVGSLDLLKRRGIGGEREQRLIAGAAQSAERAKTLVQRLLAFARRQPLQVVAVDVAALVTGMADLIASTSGPQIKVVVDAAPDLPPARADANQLEMALLNLAVNARDAMPDGGVLRITAASERVGRKERPELALGDYVRLSVADNGAGMNEATLARAVEPFFSTKGIGKGTGLGLSMVHGLVSQLGGALTINSRPGLGTNVELWLPASDEAIEVAGVLGPTTEVCGAGTVLLVDDEELARLSTADMLGDLGYSVVEAASAEEALRLMGDGLRPDLLLTDHLMPGMNGTNLARIVRDEQPGIGILLVSGYAEGEGVAPDLARLTKPFRIDELAASLAELSSASQSG